MSFQLEHTTNRYDTHKNTKGSQRILLSIAYTHTLTFAIMNTVKLKLFWLRFCHFFLQRHCCLFVVCPRCTKAIVPAVYFSLFLRSLYFPEIRFSAWVWFVCEICFSGPFHTVFHLNSLHASSCSQIYMHPVLCLLSHQMARLPRSAHIRNIV